MIFTFAKVTISEASALKQFINLKFLHKKSEKESPLKFYFSEESKYDFNLNFKDLITEKVEKINKHYIIGEVLGEGRFF